MTTIIEYTTHNMAKGGRVQSYLKEISTAKLAYYVDLANAGTIWDFLIVQL